MKHKHIIILIFLHLSIFLSAQEQTIKKSDPSERFVGYHEYGGIGVTGHRNVFKGEAKASWRYTVAPDSTLNGSLHLKSERSTKIISFTGTINSKGLHSLTLDDDSVFKEKQISPFINCIAGSSLQMLVRAKNPNTNKIEEIALEFNKPFKLSNSKKTKISKFRDSNGKFGLKDSNGLMKAQPIYDKIGFFDHYPFRNDELNEIYMKGKVALIDPDGNIVVPCIWDSIKNQFSSDLCPVKVEKKWGFINKENKLVIQPQWIKVEEFQSGIAKVYTKHEYKPGRGKLNDEEYAFLKSVFSDEILQNYKVDAFGIYVSRFYYINTKGEKVSEEQTEMAKSVG